MKRNIAAEYLRINYDSPNEGRATSGPWILQGKKCGWILRFFFGGLIFACFLGESFFMDDSRVFVWSWSLEMCGKIRKFFDSNDVWIFFLNLFHEKISISLIWLWSWRDLKNCVNASTKILREGCKNHSEYMNRSKFNKKNCATVKIRISTVVKRNSKLMKNLETNKNKTYLRALHKIQPFRINFIAHHHLPNSKANTNTDHITNSQSICTHYKQF